MAIAAESTGASWHSRLAPVIVVCGDLGAGSPGASVTALAARAAAAGASVQVVGIVADDPDGDRCLLELATANISHAAVLRGPARDLESADIDLALRYLPDVKVIVTVDVAPAGVAVASEQAGWSGAALIVIGAAIAGVAATPPDLPDRAIVIQAPASDPEGTFAGFVGVFAARLDSGAAPADAWAATTRELAVDLV
jgi:hypothetical protein